MVLLKKARNTCIYDNDQHMEEVIKSTKEQPDSGIDFDKPDLYFHSRFKYLKESNQVYVSDLKKSGVPVARRKGNSKTKTLRIFS